MPKLFTESPWITNAGAFAHVLDLPHEKLIYLLSQPAPVELPS